VKSASGVMAVFSRPGLNRADDPAATALRGAELPGSDIIDARQAFERK